MLQKAEKHEDLEIKRLHGLAASHLEALKEMDMKYKEDEFYLTVKEVMGLLFSIAPFPFCQWLWKTVRLCYLLSYQMILYYSINVTFYSSVRTLGFSSLNV